MSLQEFRIEVREKFSEFDERFARIDERFAQIDERFAKVDERFDRLESEMRAGFARVQQQFEQLQRHIDVRFEQCQDTLMAIRDVVIGGREQHQALVKRVDALETRADATESAVTVLLRKAGL